MDTGTTVYKATVLMNPLGPGRPYYMSSAVTTGIVVDGREMVRVHDSLFPMLDGWYPTKAAAKHEAMLELIRMAGMLQKHIDELREEVLHESLTTEEAVA